MAFIRSVISRSARGRSQLRHCASVAGQVQASNAVASAAGSTPAAAPSTQEFSAPEGNGDIIEASRALEEFFRRCKRVVILSGAGLSTASGIPDYRSPLGAYSKGHKPMTHQEFLGSEKKRQRYWARSIAGYSKFANTKPNRGHYALSELEKRGFVEAIITQNVDGLHGKAGSSNVIELHGRGHVVKCLSCGVEGPRMPYKDELQALNRAWIQQVQGQIDTSVQRPDGDAFIRAKQDIYSEFVVPACRACGTGIVKPDVVFFGDNVPRERADAARDLVKGANGLLVLGSSLQVYSAYRLILAAAQTFVPIAIINIGQTRADTSGIESLRFHERCEELLEATLSRLTM
mmetsp:Transcript_11714/g.35696  ORF Transcript_11714/g.35696 Transcript_11714/m.35696 type:complete len:347 (+) Transcript_11714:131-1171(+)|eukprot:CAMPEP_0198734570 /NCGR_PEP_ID=MMETSP1475-20131203/53660_1 /TAXON_ID= ORGANISM="Unidentified sp., Strain CCMP1999" /NCGR_SAMPLE_ID=MMETSP1475 /ASSEMBLY_ACC=CAM_ASM_001111 /LENGTH=346 /DNA_ID=CAMNT_0044498071 /DNA_START=62 /DNA_END=1102 /DNA_ORIENTATION=-